MATPLIPKPSIEFELNKGLLAPGSATKLKVDATADLDVYDALIHDKPFPARRDGKIPIGSVAVKENSGEFTFRAGQESVDFEASAGVRTGIGVFDRPADAMSAIGLEDVPQLNFAENDAAAAKYAAMLWGYNAKASVSDTHPLGVLSSLTFGVEGSSDGTYAVVHRFPAARGSRTALVETVASWRLPRQIQDADDLVPGTWIVSSVDGSIALKIGARIGYDISLPRQIAGLTQDLGAKIEAVGKVTLGLTASGSYLLVISREDASAALRLRVLKKSRAGFDLGLNVSVGVTGDLESPATEKFVQAAFGVHGLQILKDLRQWTEPDPKLAETAAGLDDSEARDLLRRVTGLDVEKDLASAHAGLRSALDQWGRLPERLASTLWDLVGSLDDSTLDEFRSFLRDLASPQAEVRNHAVASGVNSATVSDSAAGRFVSALFDGNLAAVSAGSDLLQRSAMAALDVLDSGVIRKLHDVIFSKLDLQPLLRAASESDFAKLDGWLIRRLSDFLEEKIDFSKLKPVQSAVNSVAGYARSVYEKAVEAAQDRGSAKFSAKYGGMTAGTSLFDVTFNMSDPAARRTFVTMVDDGGLNDLLSNQVSGVTLNKAALTHEVGRNTTVKVQMPFFDASTERILDSIATLTVEQSAGRVFVYQLNANDRLTEKNRLRSQLSVLATLRDGAVPESSIAYQLSLVKRDMNPAELRFRTEPFLRAYLSSSFTTESASLDSFYLALERTVRSALHHAGNGLGDVAIGMQVALDASVLRTWFEKRDHERLKRDQMIVSRRLQSALKKLVPLYYFQNLDNLQPNASAAALLVWSAFPCSTSAGISSGVLQLDTDGDVFWNFPDPGLRAAFVNDARTARGLTAALRTAQSRWIDAGNTRMAAFFGVDQARSFQRLALSDAGEELLHSLLFTEAAMVNGAAKALEAINAATGDMPAAPVKAIQELSEFGADLASTFNKGLSVYGNDATRPLNAMLLTEASSALSSTTPEPGSAMLSIIVLKESSTFKLQDYVSGKRPDKDQIAVARNLVNVA